jgi:hypothetical protein
MKNYLNKNINGQIIIPALVFGCVAIIAVTGFISWASLNMKMSRQAVSKEQALQIAEAGNDYYRWHLAHAVSDYKDGTSSSGPYVHDFKNKDGEVVGNFSLAITPPLVGSTVVAIKSTGTKNSLAEIKRSVETKLAIPTFAKYAVASATEVRFGTGTEIFGPVHSNGGIRFDGLAHNVVSSTKNTYTDPDAPKDNAFGVHTHVVPADPTIPPSPLPPPGVPNRTDVFEAGRTLGVPAIDFAGLTPDLQTMKTSAQSAGVYLDPSGKKGYHLVLRNNNTFDVYRVKSVQSPPSSCENKEGANSYWGTWSVNSEEFIANHPVPDNGIVFVEDDVWIEGNISGTRITVAAARFPDVDSTRASITINKNLTYTNYDGQDVIGLIAQRNINIGLDSANNLRIDAALIAQNGRVGRYYYEKYNCGNPAIRNSITLFGMIASDTRYGFSWTCGDDSHYCSGYKDRFINYDSHLLYGPPPSFPFTSDQYETISWEEVK